MINFMVKVVIFFKKVIDMMVIWKMEWKMDMVNIIIQMVIHMKVCGIKIKKMDKVHTNIY